MLACARVLKQAEDDAAREVMIAAARWASMHSMESLVGRADGWHETCLPLGYQVLRDATGTLDVTPDPNVDDLPAPSSRISVRPDPSPDALLTLD